MHPRKLWPVHPCAGFPPTVTKGLLLCLLLAVGGCDLSSESDSDDSVQKPRTRVPVEAARVERGTIRGAYSGTATLEPEAQASVAAKTQGILLELKVEEGDRVRAGQLLARLDDERPRLERNRARAALDRLANELSRARELKQKNLLSAEDYERVRFNYEAERAAFDLAELELSYTEIKAPIDGVVARRLVRVGNLIQLNQALFEIDDLDPLWAVISVPERELAVIQAGQPVVLRVDALGASEVRGTVARVAPTIDAGSGTFRVTCEFINPEFALKSGMFGRVDVLLEERQNVLVIPKIALIEEDGSSTVYVVVDGKAQRRAVITGYRRGDLVEIRNGLAEAELIVTLGATALRAGAEVELINATALGLADVDPALQTDPQAETTTADESTHPTADASRASTADEDGAGDAASEGVDAQTKDAAASDGTKAPTDDERDRDPAEEPAEVDDENADAPTAQLSATVYTVCGLNGQQPIVWARA